MKANIAFFDGIRELIAGARTTVARGVDLVQVHTNFEIGRRIVQEEQRGEDRAAYGEEVIRTLADRLTGEFGKGFSLSNLRSMRQFYLQNQHRIRQTVSGEFRALPNSPVTDWRIWKLGVPPLHPELDSLRLPPRRQGSQRAQFL